MDENKEVAFYCRVKNLMDKETQRSMAIKRGIFIIPFIPIFPDEQVIVYRDGTTNTSQFKLWFDMNLSENDRFLYGRCNGEWLRTYRIIEYSATPLASPYNHTKYLLHQYKTLKAKLRELNEDAAKHLNARRSKDVTSGTALS